jgi:hypothetical protein
MKTTVWVLTAALALPAVAALGQQNATSRENESNYAGQHEENQSTHEANQSTDNQNHAMRTGSPNDNGAGLTDNYGKTQPGSKAQKKHGHHHKSRKNANQTVPNQTDTRYTGEAHPQ